jgi:transposase
MFNKVMASYSLDLRQRIVDAVEGSIYGKRKIAELFGVHESFIYKLLRQKRERGGSGALTFSYTMDGSHNLKLFTRYCSFLS